MRHHLASALLLFILSVPGAVPGAVPALAQTGSGPARLAAPDLGSPLSAGSASAQTLSSWGAVRTGAFLVGTDAAYHSIDVAVDAQGGYHAAFMTWAFADHTNVYYGYCPPANGGACATAAGWTFVPLTEDTPHVQLRLTPEGRPRLLLSNDQIYDDGPGGRTLYRYAECFGDCTTPAGWTVVDLGYAERGGGFDSDEYNIQTFALDPQGRPRFIFFDGYDTRPDGVYGNMLFLAACDDDCTNGSNWRYTLLPDAYSEYHSGLAIAPDGRPKLIAASHDTESNTWLVYGECTAACADTGDWSEPVFLMPLPSGPGVRDWSFALDAQGRPRIAVQPLARPLHYVWCDEGCTDAGMWRGYALEFSDNDTYAALAIDGAGRPHIGFKALGSLAYAWCEGGCDTENAQWTAELVDTDVHVAADLNIPILPGCHQGSWIGGYRPQIALEPDGDVVLGHDAEFLMQCYNDPQRPNPGDTFVESKWWTSRVVFARHSGTIDAEPEAPEAVTAVLEAPHPNPSRGAATIPYTLAAAGSVRVAVYDALGREVAVLVDRDQPAGAHSVTWDGGALPSGPYFVRLATGTALATRGITLVR